MKKIFFLTILFVSSGLIFSGCAGKQKNASLNAGTGAETDSGGYRRPDFGQPERPADIRGLVKSIVGNEVTILKIDRPQNGQGLSAEDSIIQNNNNNTEAKAFSLNTGAGTSGTRMPGGVPGAGGGNFRGGAGGGTFTRENGGIDSSQIIERLKEMSAGEEKIIIPVGIQMLMPDANNLQGDPLEATLADIKTDKMLQIWLDESVSERKVANFVMITR